MPGAGDLRDRVHFQARQTVDDGYGSPVAGDWRTCFSIAAGFRALLGTESVMADRLSGVQPYVIRVRQSAQTRTVTTDWRVVDVRRPSRILNIRAISDPDGRGQWLDILAQEGVAT